MPFTITRLETGIRCPINPEHTKGVYGLIFIKNNYQFYLCEVCSAIFEHDRTYGYVPLVKNPIKRKIQTVTPEGAARLIKQAEAKKKVFAGGKAKVCLTCNHKEHFPKSCNIFVYRMMNGKRKQVKCNCKG